MGLPKEPIEQPDKPIYKGCGIVMTGHTQDDIRVVFRVDCMTRLCQRCLPKIVAAKMARIPHVPLFVTVVYADQASKLLTQLANQRKKGQDAQYVRVPCAPDKWMIVSEFPIGLPLDRDDLQVLMMNARPEWGAITTSAEWREPISEPHEESGFVVDGVCTATVQWIERLGTEEFGAPRVRDRSLSWALTAEEDARFLILAGVRTYADYWADLRALGLGGRNDWMKQFVRRITARL